MRGTTRILTLFSLMAMALLSSCGPAAKLRVHDAMLTLSPVDSNPSVIHFTVLGGQKDVYLMSVVSNSVLRTEMHESGMDAETGAMTMTPRPRVLIPAKGKVEFKKGGKHVMVWGVNQVARRLGEIELQFIFSNGDRILVKAPVRELDGSIPDERKAFE